MKNTASRRSQTKAGSKALKSAHDTASGSELAAWNFFSEIGRQQLAMITESASALYRGNETLRKIQQETAHAASVRHGEAAHKLLSPSQPADLMAIQSELLHTNVQSATQYWQQLAAATMKAQKEMMTSMSHLLDSESDTRMVSALQVVEAAMPAMAMANRFLVPSSSGARARR